MSVEIGRAVLKTALAGAAGAAKVGMEAYSGITTGPLNTWLKALVDRVDGKAAMVSGPAGSYTLSSVTINSEGLVTAASSGSAGAVADASTTVKGATKLSTAPVSPTNPIAVGDNDSRNSDARIPTAHKTSHDVGGSDSVTRFGEMAFYQAGTLTVKTGVGRYPCFVSGTIVGVRAMINTAPTGASVIADVNRNGITMYTTQGNRPAIAVSTNSVNATLPAVTTFSAGDYITVDTDQIGSGTPGADLVVIVRYSY